MKLLELKKMREELLLKVIFLTQQLEKTLPYYSQIKEEAQMDAIKISVTLRGVLGEIDAVDELYEAVQQEIMMNAAAQTPTNTLDPKKKSKPVLKVIKNEH